MRIYDLVGQPHDRRTGKRLAVIGTCRVHGPFDLLVESGRARRVWVNEQLMTHTFGEAIQSIRYVLGENEIPTHLRSFIFEPPDDQPRTDLDREIFNSVDSVVVEIPERRHIVFGSWYFNINHFHRSFVSPHAAAMLPWYRAFAGLRVTDEIVATTMQALPPLSAAEREKTEALLRQTKVEYMSEADFDTALDELTSDQRKQWIVVSPFLVPGLAGSLMEDRTATITGLQNACARKGIPLFNPSAFISTLGKHKALAKEGRDIYHYNTDIYPALADELLAAGGIQGASEPFDSIAEASAATSCVNQSLIDLHSKRVGAGIDESGLYAHYKELLDAGQIAGENIAAQADLVAHILPTFDQYYVLRAGLGELAFALAGLGLDVTGVEGDERRFAAMSAGLDYFRSDGLKLRGQIDLKHATIPRPAIGERVIAVAPHLIGYSADQESQALNDLADYSAILLRPDHFLYTRDLASQARLFEDLERIGFTDRRRFRTSGGLVYCAKPGLFPDQRTP